MGLKDHFISFGTLTIICLLISIYLRDPANELRNRLKHVINGLMLVEEQHKNLSPKVAVGYGACVDLYVNGNDLIPYSDDIGLPQHFDQINSLEELRKSFAYYFKNGAAAERYVTNSTLFDVLVKQAEQQRDFRYGIGGNAAVMAIRMSLEGCNVLLAASLSPRHLDLISSSTKVVGGSVQRDDIHLVLEYKAGETWGPFTSPRANRYILHNDKHNPKLHSMKYLRDPLKTFKPDLFIVSGLQLMDNINFAEGVRERKLTQIRDQIFSVPKSTKVHFEMASFTDLDFLNELKEYIVPYADSLGMNEQELANLYSIYRYGNVSVVTHSMPRVALVLDQMRYIFRHIRKENQYLTDSRKLTRIHVHTLAFQAVLTELGSSWKQSDVAAAKASLTAYRHVCASPEIDAERATLLMDDSFSRSVVRGNEAGRVELDPERPVPCWQEENTLLCVAAGLVCTNATQTAGGGDNISAAALAMQL
ncbi:hypothetical protein O3M35_000939 [Rhynocoris fuscipes]|uniref:ADP-dependent glucokinase n=1 Tax=Rhynocoris fuscipes TaxID=488301 RepID=A0AAW1DSK2_9HEMI